MPRLSVILEDGQKMDNGFILADEMSMTCQGACLRDIISQLLFTFYAWDLAVSMLLPGHRLSPLSFAYDKLYCDLYVGVYFGLTNYFLVNFEIILRNRFLYEPYKQYLIY